MISYERLRQQKKNIDMYNRLNGYFNALENDKLDEYHNQHGRKKE